MASYRLAKKEQKQGRTKKKFNFRITKRGVGVALMVFSCIAFVALFSGVIGFFKSFLLGCFGLSAYALFIVMFFVGLALANKRRYINSPLYILYVCLATLSLLSIIDLALYHGFNGSFGEYLANAYNKKLTAGGFVVGFFTSLLRYTIFEAGAFVVCSVVLVVSVALIIDYMRYAKNVKMYMKPQKVKQANVDESRSFAVSPEKAKNETNEPKQKDVPKITLSAQIDAQKAEVMSARELLGLDKKMEFKSSNISDKKPPIFDRNNKEQLRSYLLSEPENYSLPKINVKMQDVDDKIDKLKGEMPPSKMPQKIVHDDVISKNTYLDVQATPNQFEQPSSITNQSQEIFYDEQNDKSDFVDQDAPNNDTFKVLQEQVIQTINQDNQPKQKEIINAEAEQKKKKDFVQINFDGQIDSENKFSTQKRTTHYSIPPIDIFTTKSVDPHSFDNDIESKKIMLEHVLETFKVPAKVIDIIVGPAVTRYELEMPMGISVKKINAHHDDIALALAAKGDIRIEAPIPGKSAVGIEVPNEKIAMVSIKEILSSREFVMSKSPLPIALGKDINGEIKICDLTKMPHLLVAGATNSGKSVCLNAVLISLIQKLSPDELKLILIDPKRVEFSMYNKLPHLIMPKVICDSEKAINALGWAVDEMERRYMKFEDSRCRNIGEYNARQQSLSLGEKMCYIVIIIDELADLMTVGKREVEERLMRLAQKARAAGIHMVVATQRPSVDVITGTIKTNFPSRISFALSSFADSKTILDQGGADKLLGKGDMLYKPADASSMTRIQGCFMSGTEVENYVGYVIDNNPDYDFDIEIEKAINNMKQPSPSDLVDGRQDGYDELFKQALRLVIENGQASITVVQRKLQVGYPRAARIIDQMEEAGYISASDGSKPRSIYITMEEWEQIFGND